MKSGERLARWQVSDMRRRDFVHALLESEAIRSAWVRAAFEAVPREVFVPRFLRWVGDQQVLVDGTVDGTDAGQRAEWLRGVYSDEALTVQMTAAADVVDPAGLPTGSSSAPSVMASMLEALDLQRGQRVLEIGTGTGYNAALLSQRVGDGNVVTVELDPQLADAARDALAEVGLYPAVHVGDGAAGVPDAAPFDRIIATAAISYVPPAWIEQLAPGGVIVANLRGNLAGGIVRLTRSDDAGEEGEVVGAFLDIQGLFMPMRTRLDSPYWDGEDWSQVVFDQLNPQVTRTALDPAVLVDSSYRFLLQLHLAGRRLRGFLPGMAADAIASGRSADGSWFDVVDQAPEDAAGYIVRQGGPQRLWDTVETAHAAWQQLGRPAPGRFTVVADADADLQHIRYLAGDGVEWRWPLPL